MFNHKIAIFCVFAVFVLTAFADAAVEAVVDAGGKAIDRTLPAEPNRRFRRGAGDVVQIGEVAMDFVNQCKEWASSNNEVSEKREEFIQRTIKHWQTAKPDYNVMVLNNKVSHDVTIKDGVHMHVEIPRKPSGTHGFDVYVFKSGTITRHGDGGNMNWGFAGKFERDGETVKFSE